jgi:ABC-type Fe3+-hydroxamate transport system substrate-binding protein
MNSKILMGVIGAIVVIGAIFAFATFSVTDDDGPIEFTDSMGRKISIDEPPEKVAVVNTDLAYYMVLLGIEEKIVAMDTDGLEKMVTCSDVFRSVTDIGKRGTFSTSTAIEKMKLDGVDMVISPSSMGIGSTVLADVIENSGIKVVYLDAFGNGMLDNLDKMVSLFGGSDDLKERAKTYKDMFNKCISDAKAICPTPDRSIDFLCYMFSSAGTVGNYYLSTSELSGLIASMGGTNAAYATSGSFTTYKNEALYNLFYDGDTPVLDVHFIRGSDTADYDLIVQTVGSQSLTSSIDVKKFSEINPGCKTIYLNTHLASGLMSCYAYLLYAYVFTDTLDDNHIEELESRVNAFMDGIGLNFVVDDDHPLVRNVVY